MMQIRLTNTKGGPSPSSPEAAAAGGPEGTTVVLKQLAVDGVTVACPEHLILADLPVAKSVGTVGNNSNFERPTKVKIVGRKVRGDAGQRIHCCIRCDFPIGIYGRLTPCDHAFCLDCARSEPSCCLCDERIQKIQQYKALEGGIYICGAPHCLKSFLEASVFKTHIQENHPELLKTSTEQQEGSETNIPADAQAKQSVPAESSTARAATPRLGLSTSSNPQPHDFEDKTRRFQSREQTPLRPPLPMMQPRPPFYAPNYPPPLSHQPPSFLVPVPVNQGTNPPAFNYTPFTSEGAQPLYSVPDGGQGGSEQNSFVGYPPPLGFAPWDIGVAAMQFQQFPISVSQGGMEGYTNFQGGYPLSSPFMAPVGTKPLEPPQVATSDQKDGKGVQAPSPHGSQNMGNPSYSGDTAMDGQGY